MLFQGNNFLTQSKIANIIVNGDVIIIETIKVYFIYVNKLFFFKVKKKCFYFYLHIIVICFTTNNYGKNFAQFGKFSFS